MFFKEKVTPDMLQRKVMAQRKEIIRLSRIAEQRKETIAKLVVERERVLDYQRYLTAFVDAFNVFNKTDIKLKKF